MLVLSLKKFRNRQNIYFHDPHEIYQVFKVNGNLYKKPKFSLNTAMWAMACLKLKTNKKIVEAKKWEYTKK